MRSLDVMYWWNEVIKVKVYLLYYKSTFTIFLRLPFSVCCSFSLVSNDFLTDFLTVGVVVLQLFLLLLATST